MLKNLSLRAKLMLAMLLAAGLGMLSMAALGYLNVARTFNDRLDTRLVAVSSITSKRIESYFQTTAANLSALSEDIMIIESLSWFESGIEQIDLRVAKPDFERDLGQFYANDFGPQLVAKMGGKADPEAFLPKSQKERYLQYAYVVANKNKAGEGEKLDSTGDQSFFDANHARYHPPLRNLKEGFGYYDLFLISASGKVVYSVEKEVDFMSDLTAGPFNTSGLAKAFNDAKDRRGTKQVVTVDYDFYEPSFGAPSAFMATAIMHRGEFKGVIAVQLPADHINSLVHNNKSWKEIALGETGDIYLVGADGTMRSTLRKFEENKKDFIRQSELTGTQPNALKLMNDYSTPINLQPLGRGIIVNPEEASLPYISTAKNALNIEARNVAIPLNVGNLDWTLVTEMPTAEANTSLNDFVRSMLLALAMTTGFVTLASMFLSQRFVQPLKTLKNYLTAVARGEEPPPIDTTRQDEMAEVALSGREAIEGFRNRIAEIDRGKSETETLLSRFLPESIVRQIKAREMKAEEQLDDVVEVVPNASFILGKLSGYEGMMAALEPHQVVAALDQLVQMVDAAAERTGVEKLRTAGDTYFAIAGLSTPLIDHSQRAIAFALELQEIVERFSSEKGVNLQVKIGISTGDAVSGLIGRQRLAFDVWGKPVSEVENLMSVSTPGQIRSSAEFANRLRDTHKFSVAKGEAGQLFVGPLKDK